MTFERELASVWIVDLSRYVVDGGDKFVSFKAVFTFKSADGSVGLGPKINVRGAIECTGSESYSEIEALARVKAMDMVRRLGAETEASLDAVIAAEDAENSKTKEQREKEWSDEYAKQIERDIENSKGS